MQEESIYEEEKAEDLSDDIPATEVLSFHPDDSFFSSVTGGMGYDDEDSDEFDGGAREGDEIMHDEYEETFSILDESDSEDEILDRDKDEDKSDSDDEDVPILESDDSEEEKDIPILEDDEVEGGGINPKDIEILEQDWEDEEETFKVGGRPSNKKASTESATHIQGILDDILS